MTTDRQFPKKTRCILFSGIVLSFLLTLWVDYIGEEGVYTISTLEMLATNNWSYPQLWGCSYDRPGMFNWLIAGVSWLGPGVNGILLSSRLVTIIATLISSLVVFNLAKLIFKSDEVGVYSFFAYLSGDVLFRRGWLAYADPLFSCFILLSIYMLWIWVEKDKHFAIFLSLLFLISAILSKTYTAVLFYGAAITYFVFSKKYSKKIINLKFVSICALFMLCTFWGKGFVLGAGGKTSRDFIYNIKQSFLDFSVLSYSGKIITFPITVLLLYFPLSFFCLYVLYKNKKGNCFKKELLPCAIILLFSLLPYWIVPTAIKARYILPAMPWLAIIIGFSISRGSEPLKKIAIKLTVAAVVIKLAITPWFYYHQTKSKGNATDIALSIIKITKLDYSIYVDNSTAKELRVAAALDVFLLQAKKPLVYSVSLADTPNYYLLSSDVADKTRVLSSYKIEGGTLYLQCFNDACQHHKG